MSRRETLGDQMLPPSEVTYTSKQPPFGSPTARPESEEEKYAKSRKPEANAPLGSGSRCHEAPPSLVLSNLPPEEVTTLNRARYAVTLSVGQKLDTYIESAREVPGIGCDCHSRPPSVDLTASMSMPLWLAAVSGYCV